MTNSEGTNIIPQRDSENHFRSFFCCVREYKKKINQFISNMKPEIAINVKVKDGALK